MNKKGMFTGFSKVFGFTASQNVKGKGFKASTILLGILIAVIFALISIIQAAVQDEDDKADGDINNAVDAEESFGADIYVVNHSGLEFELIAGITQAELFKECHFTQVQKNDEKSALEDTNGFLEGKRNSLVMAIEENDESFDINYYIPYDTELTRSSVDMFGTAFQNYYEFIKVNMITELNSEQLMLYTVGVSHADALAAGEEPDTVGVMVAKLIIPMMFSLALYMMILMYGQNITKIVVAEKSSKLMETLLTSVKPYAIIAGKITAVAGMAIVQMFIWIISGIVGFVVGDRLAQSLNPGYTNYLTAIIDVIKEGTSAFSAASVIIAILMLLMGFLMYSVLAGLVAATVERMEDISSAMSIFQIPVVVGFLASYFIEMTESSALKQIIRFLPLTSPFSVSAELMVGNMSIGEGVASLLLVAIATFALIVFTGKVYKGRLFNSK